MYLIVLCLNALPLTRKPVFVTKRDFFISSSAAFFIAAMKPENKSISHTDTCTKNLTHVPRTTNMYQEQQTCTNNLTHVTRTTHVRVAITSTII